MFEIEKRYTDKNLTVAGVDEAGRGPLAGPVVVACCVMPTDDIITDVNDSKKLTAKKREKLFEIIKQKAICYEICEIDNNVIDEINILNATKRGALQCMEKINANIFLIDGNMKFETNKNYESIIKGDSKCYSIACASILAKVYRDELMKNLERKYDCFEFKKHKGYGTKLHYEKIKQYGISDIHRKSFLKKVIDENI